MPSRGEATSAYYPIQYPYTLDVNWDARDESQPSGTFPALVNYIPSRQILMTRLGITELNHVASVGGGGIPE